MSCEIQIRKGARHIEHIKLPHLNSLQPNQVTTHHIFDQQHKSSHLASCFSLFGLLCNGFLLLLPNTLAIGLSWATLVETQGVRSLICHHYLTQKSLHGSPRLPPFSREIQRKDKWKEASTRTLMRTIKGTKMMGQILYHHQFREMRAIVPCHLSWTLHSSYGGMGQTIQRTP